MLHKTVFRDGTHFHKNDREQEYSLKPKELENFEKYCQDYPEETLIILK